MSRTDRPTHIASYRDRTCRVCRSECALAATFVPGVLSERADARLSLRYLPGEGDWSAMVGVEVEHRPEINPAEAVARGLHTRSSFEIRKRVCAICIWDFLFKRTKNNFYEGQARSRVLVIQGEGKLLEKLGISCTDEGNGPEVPIVKASLDSKSYSV